MIVPLQKFNLDMLPTERQPIYQNILQRTEFISRDFASKKPTNKHQIISFFEAINRLDQEVGESLLMKGPEDLNIQFNSILHRSPYSHNIDAYKNDPLTVGLIDGDSPVIPPTEKLIIFKSKVPGLFIRVEKIFNNIRMYEVNSSLIGSNNPVFKKVS